MAHRLPFLLETMRRQEPASSPSMKSVLHLDVPGHLARARARVQVRVSGGVSGGFSEGFRRVFGGRGHFSENQRRSTSCGSWHRCTTFGGDSRRIWRSVSPGRYREMQGDVGEIQVPLSEQVDHARGEE